MSLCLCVGVVKIAEELGVRVRESRATAKWLCFFRRARISDISSVFLPTLFFFNALVNPKVTNMLGPRSVVQTAD